MPVEVAVADDRLGGHVTSDGDVRHVSVADLKVGTDELRNPCNTVFQRQRSEKIQKRREKSMTGLVDLDVFIPHNSSGVERCSVDVCVYVCTAVTKSHREETAGRKSAISGRQMRVGKLNLSNNF